MVNPFTTFRTRLGALLKEVSGTDDESAATSTSSTSSTSSTGEASSNWVGSSFVILVCLLVCCSSFRQFTTGECGWGELTTVERASRDGASRDTSLSPNWVVSASLTLQRVRVVGGPCALALVLCCAGRRSLTVGGVVQGGKREVALHYRIEYERPLGCVSHSVWGRGRKGVYSKFCEMMMPDAKW